MVKMYQAIDRPRNGFRDALNYHYVAEYTIATAITVFPSHLASAKTYLLAGKDGIDLARVLFLPETGPPEIKDLCVALNQILARLEEAARSVKVPSMFYGGSEVGSDEESSDEESSDVESERAAMSAEEDESGTFEL